MFFPTAKYLGSYSCCWDFCSGHAYNERTDEFFYQDVVSVSTQTDDRAMTFRADSEDLLGASEKITDVETFRLSVSSGDEITVALSSQQVQRRMLKKKAKNARAPIGDYDRAIKTIRKFLREKK